MILGHLSPISIVRTEPLGSNSEGQAVVAVVKTSTTARVAMLSASELAVAASYGEACTAVACVELGTDVVDSDTIEVSEMAAQVLDGEWKITAIRSTPLHLRVLLRRP